MINKNNNKINRNYKKNKIIYKNNKKNKKDKKNKITNRNNEQFDYF